MASQPERRYPRFSDGRTAEQHQSIQYVTELLREAPGLTLAQRMRLMETIAEHMLFLTPLVREYHIRLRCVTLEIMTEYLSHERIHEAKNGRLLNLIRDVLRALE